MSQSTFKDCQGITVNRAVVTVALLLTLVAGACLLVPAGAQEGNGLPGKQAIQTPANKLKELQQERIDTLRSIADLNAELHANGKVSPDVVLESKVLVFEAQVDAAAKEADRVNILRNLVEVLRGHEETLREKSGQNADVASLASKARRLQAQIQLERAQAPGQVKTEVSQRQKVVVANPRKMDVLLHKHFACQIHAHQHIDVRVQQSGHLEESLVKEGQSVRRGEVLFRVAPGVCQAKLDIAEAEVKLASQLLSSGEKLAEKQQVSKEEVARLKIKLETAKVQEKLALAELQRTVVRAPFDGVIGRLRQHIGSLVTEQDILTTLSDNSLMSVQFNVPQAFYLEFMANADQKSAEIELMLAPGTKYPQRGKRVSTEGEFDRATETISLYAEFPNPEGLLVHGMNGNVVIRQTAKDAIVIPKGASFRPWNKDCVWVVDKSGTVQRREILVQHELADKLVIKSGLDVSDQVVVAAERIREHDKVDYEIAKP